MNSKQVSLCIHYIAPESKKIGPPIKSGKRELLFEH